MPPAPPTKLEPRRSRPAVGVLLPARLSVGLRAGGLLLALLLIAPQPNLPSIARAIAEAQAATIEQKYDAAADMLAAAATRLPYDGYLVYRAGLSEISAGRFGEAIRHLLISGALDGWNATRRIALGDAYLGLKDSGSALAEWEHARVDQPQNDGLLARLANQYEASGRYPEAIETLQALAQLRGGDAAVFYRLALLSAATTPDEAVARLVMATDIGPELAPATQSLIDAIEAGHAAGDPAYTSARVGFALIQLKEWPLAELSLARAVAQNASYADAFAYLGLAQDMQDKDGAPAYAEAIRLAPDSPLAQYLFGLHWRRAGESEKALPYLRSAQALDPQNPAIAAEIGGAFASLGELATAEIWFTDAVRMDERNPDFWLLLARFYVDNEYHVAELGLPAARQAVGLNPNSALAADALGFALFFTGDHANAQKLYERAVGLDAACASAYYHLGLLFAAQGLPTEAQAALNHALALDPEGPYGGLALKALARLSP